MPPLWPLPVASHLLSPAGPVPVDDGGCIHLCDQPAGAVTAETPTDVPDAIAVPAASNVGLRSPAVTLCGRPAMVMAVDPALDILGTDHRRLCGSCWRIVERWLSPPPPAHGELLVVAWLVETVLAVGEAMIEGVPVPRFEQVRRHARSAIKAAIGGSVRTVKVSPTVMWVWSGLVNDAKTDERRHQEMRDALERVSNIADSRFVEAPRWRRSWSEIVTDE